MLHDQGGVYGSWMLMDRFGGGKCNLPTPELNTTETCECVSIIFAMRRFAGSSGFGL